MFNQIVEKIPWRRLVKFIITGGVALLIDIVIYFILTRYFGIYYLLSRTFSLGIAIIWNFNVNRYWTFRATAGQVKEQALKFLVVIGLTSFLSLGLMHIGVSYLHLNDLLVLLVVSIITTLINFSAHTFWSYAQQDK